MASFTSLPIIDIGPLLEKSDDPRLAEYEDVAEVVRQLDHACKEIGFFYAKGHRVSNDLMEQVLTVSREFFQLSYEEKINIKMSSSTGFRGYQRVGENVTQGRPDMHEAIDYYKEIEREAYGDLGSAIYGPNQWPKVPANFQSTMEEYIKIMTGIAKKIMRGIALALGGPPNAFEGETAGNPFWVMRVIGYPPLLDENESIEVEDSEISCGAHTDYGLLTLVNQDAEVSALQVKNRSGDWIWAPPIPGTFVVNIGDMLKVWSCGIYVPTLHRVINKNLKYRVSVPFFLEPNFDAIIEPLEFCKGKDGAYTNFPRIVYGEHLTRKVLTNFG